MKDRSILQQLLADDQWDSFRPMMERLQDSAYWFEFESALSSLKREALYTSLVHGEGHIERTLLHGTFCAMEEHLNREDTVLLLNACSYHDVGRINDWLDPEHGHRSAGRLEELTDVHGQELTIMQAIVDAHSRADSELGRTLHAYPVKDYPRALRLAELLKDADGLDRVRIHNLDTHYLRREASVKRADFALYLFSKYELYIALSHPFENGRM